MKRFIIILLIIIVSVFLLLKIVRNQVRSDLSQPVVQPALTPSPTVVIDKLKQTNTSMFVPSWTVASITNASFDRYIYFGITPTRSGIDTTAAGEALDAFFQQVPEDKQTFLTLQMQNTDTNGAILQNKTLQQQV